jgi:hypothetical protein
MEPLGVLAQYIAADNPLSLAGSIPDLISDPVAADEAPSAAAQWNVQLNRINQTIEKLKAKRDKALNNAGVKSERDAIMRGYEIDVGPLNKQKGEIENNLNAITKSQTEAEKSWEEVTPQSEKDFWFKKAPEYSGETAAVLSALMKGGGPKAAAVRYGLLPLLGAIEGTYAGLKPQFYNANLPSSSPAKQQADKNWTDPRFWAYQVAPKVGEAALTSAAGATIGSKARQGVEGVADLFRRGPKVNPATMTAKPIPGALRPIQTQLGLRYQYPTGGWASQEAVRAAVSPQDKALLETVAKRRAVGAPPPKNKLLPRSVRKLLPPKKTD